MRRTYQDSYYKTCYTMQEGFHTGFEVASLPESAVDAVIKKPWAADGMNFSDRIWRDKDKLLRTLQDELTQGLIRGDPQDAIVRRFAKRMGVSLSSAGRLIATESAFFAAKGSLDGLKYLGVEKYQFVATLDRRTSDICRSMDMKIIPVKDFQPGVTAPPLHCWCRSCIVPYMGDNAEGLRASRDEEGKTTYIPDMAYKDWKAVYVEKTKTLADIGQRPPRHAIIEEKIASGEISLTVNQEKQARHDKNSPLYQEGRSYMLIPLNEIQDIVNQYAGTGFIPTDKRDEWKHKEVITLPYNVGVMVDEKTKKEVSTKRITIHYSKTGLHVVPTRPDEGGE